MLCKQTYSKFPFRNFSTFGFSGRTPKAFYRTIFLRSFFLRLVLISVSRAQPFFLSLIDFQRLSSEISSPHFYRQSLGYKVKSPLPLWADRWQWNEGYSTALGSRNFRRQLSQSVLGLLPFYSVQLYLHLLV